MTGRPVLRFPRPLTEGQIRAVPLRMLVRPAPIGRGVRVPAECVVPPPSRALARAWASVGDVVACEHEPCRAPVRARTLGEVVGALLGDVGPAPAMHDCLWHGPAGVAREYPPVWPVEVCIGRRP